MIRHTKKETKLTAEEAIRLHGNVLSTMTPAALNRAMLEAQSNVLPGNRHASFSATGVKARDRIISIYFPKGFPAAITSTPEVQPAPVITSAAPVVVVPEPVKQPTVSSISSFSEQELMNELATRRMGAAVMEKLEVISADMAGMRRELAALMDLVLDKAVEKQEPKPLQTALDLVTESETSGVVPYVLIVGATIAQKNSMKLNLEKEFPYMKWVDFDKLVPTDLPIILGGARHVIAMGSFSGATGKMISESRLAVNFQACTGGSEMLHTMLGRIFSGKTMKVAR